MGLVALLAAEKQSEASQPSSDEPNAALKVAFKVAQFAYYAVILARYAGDALKLALALAHTALEIFLPMLSTVAKTIA